MTFKVVTSTGTAVDKGPNGVDLTESAARASAARRNAEAERLGIATRYEVAPTGKQAA